MLAKNLIRLVIAVSAVSGVTVRALASPQPQGCWSDACGAAATTYSTLVSPLHVTSDAFNHVFVYDGVHRIVRCDSQGRCDLSWLLNPRLPQVEVETAGLVVVPDGRLFLADLAYGYIRYYGPAGDSLGYYRLENSVVRPSGLALDRNNDLVVCDNASNQVLRYTTSGVLIQQWAVSGMSSANALFGVTVDDSNNVYVVDYPESKILKFTLSGMFVKSWGGVGSGLGQFGKLGQIVADHAGHIFASDLSNDRILSFDVNGNYLEEWGAPGSAEGQYNYPFGMTVDGLDNLYVADFHNDRVCKYGPGPVASKRGTWGTLKLRYR